MKTKILLLFLALAAVSSLHAQIPGYQGKRIALSVDVLTFPAFINPTRAAGNVAGSGKFLGFNWRVRGTMDFTISRKVSMGLDVQGFQTAVSAYNFPGANPSNINNLTINTIMAGINLKLHFRRFLSPLGPFIKFGLHSVIVNTSDAASNFVPNGSEISQRKFMVAAEVGFGRRHIFFNRMMLNYGFDIMVALPYNPVLYGFSKQTDLSWMDMGTAGAVRVSSHLLTNLYFGVGVIL